ncbi:cytochrome P450 [Streptomyces eurocidicus]|uniref:Cytochrome P450 n=1 Tax=Streptomyces eurocidicus TaxID=66423 RepID=A0A2N8NVL4_STREU|nr:cytochrome P450 [Streptomyces eurocidicus]MBB5122287.1 cytochrome P450 [Streptomyces eurocidicus]MBF6055171.1 cytochrome P450 [Streptomyces eurocidicus]PNE32804.1 cytochrome P450 [Streptomyces eurocidicus]
MERNGTERTTAGEHTGGCPAVDLFSADFTADPWPAFARLQHTSPVHHDPTTGLWLVSRHRDVRRILLDPERFRPDNTLDAVARMSIPALRHLAAAGFALPPTLANNGTDRHPGLRSLVSGLLSGARVTAAAPLVERLTHRHLDAVEAELAAHGHCDLVTTLTRDLPFTVMLDILGLRADVDADTGVDLTTLARWNDASLELFWGLPPRARQPGLARLAADFFTWLGGLADRAAPGGPGLLGLLAAHRHPDGTPLGRQEIVAVCYFMIIAGQATTGQMLATMLQRALHDTALWPRLGTEPGLAQAWAEEMLRREPPLTAWRRVTAAPVRIGGTALPAGAPLLLMLAATGSDPRVFDAPHALRPGRPRARDHLSFGIGRHRCPGAALARMEARVVLRTVSHRCPTLRPARPAAEEPLLGLLSFRAPMQVMVRPGGDRGGDGG